jgi:Fe-S oxidoreductase/nitrate reductase gamma subunit
MTNETVPGREIFFHMSLLAVGAFYALTCIALGVLAYGLWLRIRKYRSGKPTAFSRSVWQRIVYVARSMGAHTTLQKRNRLAGLAHWLIFWGFAVLFLGSAIIAVDHDLLKPINSSLHFWKGRFYEVYSALLDVMGLGLLAGLLFMGARRWGQRPPQLDYTRADRRVGEYDRNAYRYDDLIFLGGLICIVLTGFLNEGLRIAADRPAFEIWSVVGWRFADGLNALGLTAATAARLRPYAWWLHAAIALAFIAYIPYSKAIHMLAALANLFCKDPVAGKLLPAIAEDSATIGYQSLADFSWKQLLELDACTKCGRCHIACPARAGGWPLSPRDFILQLREHAEAELGGRSWFAERPTQPGGRLVGDVIKADTVWSCTTCLACVETCPVAIEHVPMIVQMRRHLIAEGTVDRNMQSTLEKLARYGNSFGEPERDRGKWTEGLDFTIKDARKEAVDILWFVGDFASYDPDQRQITQNVARIFHRAGLDFGILYDGEHSAGNDIRRVGEEGLYQLLLEHNATAFGRARFREIVTTDPHSYNTIKHEYSTIGAIYPIRHYTEVIDDLIRSGKLRVTKQLKAKVTYHDPCHLSRYTGVIDEPRRVLTALGVTLVEMKRNRANSFCCGAGGGRIWMTGTGTGERPSEQRIKEALTIPGLEAFIVACPKDFKMFSEAVRATGNEGRLAVKDLIELVEEGTRDDARSSALAASASALLPH